MRGRLDALIETENGYWVVDYKTGKPKSDVPGYYQTQLDGYAFLVEKNIGRVIGGGLLYFYPRDGNLSNGNIPFDIRWVEARLKPENIKPKLLRIREILNMSYPPPPSRDCDRCKWLQEAGYRLL